LWPLLRQRFVLRLADVCIGCDRTCQSQAYDRISRLLHFIRLHSSLSVRHPRVSSLGIDDSEIPIILAAAEQLLGEESEVRQELVRGILFGEGEFQGISRELGFSFSFESQTHPLTVFNFEQTRDSLNWHMLSRHHKPNQTLMPLKSLNLRCQNHRKKSPVLLEPVLVGKHRHRGDSTSCKRASSITLLLGTVRSGWMSLKTKRPRRKSPPRRSRHPIAKG
jgi:hypothetical protein